MAIVENYPSNSHAAKAHAAEAKKVARVVQGGVKRTKRSGTKKLLETFITEDAAVIKDHILLDVLVPTIKKAISDMVVNGIDILLYGESGRTRRSGNVARVSYAGCYGGSERRRSTPNANRNAVDYEDLTFETRSDADAVLDSMNEIISGFGKVSIGDLYDMAGVSNNNYTLNNYGWTDIAGCRSVRVPDGYSLKLPRPVSLK